jgi:hypothetical protein
MTFQILSDIPNVCNFHCPKAKLSLIDPKVVRCWIFSWAMSHICANDEYRSQRKHRHWLRQFRLSLVDVVSFHLQNFHWLIAQRFSRSQPMRKSNTPISGIFEQFTSHEILELVLKEEIPNCYDHIFWLLEELCDFIGSSII